MVTFQASGHGQTKVTLYIETDPHGLAERATCSACRGGTCAPTWSVLAS